MNKDDEKKFKGNVNKFDSHEIYLNVKHLNDGVYTLNIIYKNKVIKKTTFKKE